jgi:ferredoxin-NADP reductase/DMSO/TMAO reductase YedYZ heme-binding membrane subunit
LAAVVLGGFALVLATDHSAPSGADLGPPLYRAVERTTGLLAVALLSLSVLGGVLVPARRRGSRVRRVHAGAGVLAAACTALHLGFVMAVPWLGVGWLQLWVPFTRALGRLPQGCGVLATYLLVAVVLTSAARTALPWRWWRRAHSLGLPAFGLAFAHAVFAASAGRPGLLHASATALIAAALCLLLLRHLQPGPAGPRQPGVDAVEPVAGDSAPTEHRQPRCVVVDQQTWEADGVMSLSLTSPTGATLPDWTPGAHIEIRLPSGRQRRYSLCGNPAQRDRYRVAVQRKQDGRGGSREVHDRLRPGIALQVWPPRNNVALVPAPSYLLVAGGIGITCLLPMAQALALAGARWELVYGGRTRSRMAFLDRLAELDPYRVRVVPEDEQGLIELAPLLDGQPPGTAVYCCGPPGLVDTVTALVSTRPGLSLHTEQFAPGSGLPCGSKPVTLELRRTGTTVEVPADSTLLAAVASHAPRLAGGCEQGVCGRCQVTVLAGEPEHHDTYLTPRERAAGQMLLCVSRAHCPQLTLDL